MDVLSRILLENAHCYYSVLPFIQFPAYSAGSDAAYSQPAGADFPVLVC